MKEKEREKNVKKKLMIYDIVVVSLTLVIFSLMCFGPWKQHDQKFVVRLILFIISEGAFFLFYFALIRCALKMIYFQYEEEKQSKKIVEENLSEKNIEEVIPIDTENYKDFVLKTLPQMAKFYAIIDDFNNELVIIYIKFNHENSYKIFEKVPKDKFIYFYKVVD